MKRVHPIHARARVVIEIDAPEDLVAYADADDCRLVVQGLDEFGWRELGAHCVVENPEREAADLAAEFRAVAEAIEAERLRAVLEALRHVASLTNELAVKLFERAGEESSIFLLDCAEEAFRIQGAAEDAKRRSDR